MADKLRVKPYRFEQAGRPKDWAFPAAVYSSDAELVVYFGVTGKALRQAVTPAARCVNNDPVAEANSREREKLGKGYRYLGEYQLNLINRRELVALKVNEPEVSVSPPCLYWERRPTPGLDDPPTGKAIQILYELVDDCLTRLLATGLISRKEVQWQEPDHKRWQFHIQNRDGRCWWFGFIYEAPNAPLPIAVQGLNSRGSGRGVILLTPDSIAEILFFLLLRQVDSALALADESGQLVTSWPQGLVIEPEVLLSLGIAMESPELLLATVDIDAAGWFY